MKGTIFTPAGKIRSFNAAAGELFGVPADRARDRALIEIVRNFELDRRVTATLRAGLDWYGALLGRRLDPDPLDRGKRRETG